MSVHATRPQTPATPTPTSSTPATSQAGGHGLSRELMSAVGFEAQERLLTPRESEDAIDYNTRHNDEPGYARALQSYLGAAASGRFDAPTVEVVARFQDGEDLVVDGKVGAKTRGALREDGFEEAPAPLVPLVPKDEPPTPAGPKGPGGAPPGKAEPPVVEAPRPEAPPKAGPGERPPPGAQPPTSFGSGPVLEVDPFESWLDARAERTDSLLAELAALAEGSPRYAALELAARDGHDALRVSAEALRARAIGLVSEASLLRSPDRQAILPSRASMDSLSASLRRVSRAGGEMAAASHVGQDAVLAIRQGASVLSARATWAERPREASGKDEVGAQKKRAGDPLNAVFRDSGFASRITTNKDGSRVTDWCGMFVGASLFRGGGLDEELRKGLLHTSNVLDYFRYQQKANATRAPRSIWAEGRWHELSTYHAERGSLRRWQERETIAAQMAAGDALDLRPGDVVLIDHSGKGKKPNHITMVESYDPETHVLVTIEGNTRGIQAAPDGQAPALGEGQFSESREKRSGSGLHTRDMTDMNKATRARHADQHAANEAHNKAAPKGAYRGKSGSTVFGVGRPSAVDFEEHTYATKRIPSELVNVSPEDLSSKAKDKVGLQTAS